MNNQSLEIICHDNFDVLCKVNAIMQDIIKIKSENRSIGQRIKHLHKKRSEYIKVIKSNKGNKNILREYNKKADSNINLEILLTKLQKSNSKLIRRHRSKIQQLRKGLM